MKIIDLLNKIANGEFLPKKIKYDDEIFIYDNQVDKYWSIDHTNNLYDILGRYVGIALNDEVEIIEEEPRDIEVCGSLFTRSEYNRLAGIEEDKKIVKLKKDNFGKNKDLDEVDSDIYFVVDKINEIIDYLNKGDK